jgi:Zn-dependent M28 family amino/carboxypeptidase
VIAETRGGDPNKVVVVGAHLDSVGPGPGINDNGSGSATLVEFAQKLRGAKLKNKVRFIWFSAERPPACSARRPTSRACPRASGRRSPRCSTSI